MTSAAKRRSCYIADEDCSTNGYTSTLPDGRVVCNTHYGRWSRRGDPEYKPTIKRTRRGEIDKWVAWMLEVDDDECWLWPFDTVTPPHSPGYGAFGKWKNTTAARAVLKMAKGDPPDPAFHACHLSKCKGKPLCVNPNHLYWGSAKDNAADKLADGTQVRGEDHWAATMSNAKAQAIWDANGTRQEIADRFGTTLAIVGAIKESRRWLGIDRSKPAGGIRRGKVTVEMCIAVIPDARKNEEIGRDHGISAGTVSLIKNGHIHPELDRTNVVINKPGGSGNMRSRKLNLELAQDIYDDTRPPPMIARDHGVTTTMVERIKDGEAWLEIDRTNPPGRPDPAEWPNYCARYGNRKKRKDKRRQGDDPMVPDDLADDDEGWAA